MKAGGPAHPCSCCQSQGLLLHERGHATGRAFVLSHSNTRVLFQTGEGSKVTTCGRGASGLAPKPRKTGYEQCFSLPVPLAQPTV